MMWTTEGKSSCIREDCSLSHPRNSCILCWVLSWWSICRFHGIWLGLCCWPFFSHSTSENIASFLHTFVNWAIVPEFLLDDDNVALHHLDLKPWMPCLQLQERLASDRYSLVEAVVHSQALQQHKVLINVIYTFRLREMRKCFPCKIAKCFHASELPRQLSFLR